MMTRAGRLSSTISHGSARRSAIRERPIASPIAAPSSIAIANAAATRASVTPRLKASAPERASSRIASATACGSGSRRGPASCDPAYQAAISSASEMSLTAKAHSPYLILVLFLGRAVEGAGCELARRADQLRAADVREDEIQGAGVVLLVRQRAAHDAFTVALAIDRERARVGDADARGKPLPFGVGRRQDVLGLPHRVEETVDSGTTARSEGAFECVADDRHRSLGAEPSHD